MATKFKVDATAYAEGWHSIFSQELESTTPFVVAKAICDFLRTMDIPNLRKFDLDIERIEEETTENV